jgi:hypothetical protein
LKDLPVSKLAVDEGHGRCRCRPKTAPFAESETYAFWSTNEHQYVRIHLGNWMSIRGCRLNDDFKISVNNAVFIRCGLQMKEPRKIGKVFTYVGPFFLAHSKVAVLEADPDILDDNNRWTKNQDDSQDEIDDLVYDGH